MAATPDRAVGRGRARFPSLHGAIHRLARACEGRAPGHAVKVEARDLAEALVALDRPVALKPPKD